MEIRRIRNISHKEEELLLNALNSLFAREPSSFGYKYDIEIILKELAIKEDELLTLVLECLSRVKRNNDDLIFITSYLFFMDEFIKLLKAKESYRKENKLLNYILRLSSDIFHLEIPSNCILMKYGDKGDKAFINLYGEVDVLVPNSKIMKVFEIDYLFYLASLINYKEYYLINSVLNDNFRDYPIIIYEDFSSFDDIISIFGKTNMSKIHCSTFIKRKKNEIIKTSLDINNLINQTKIRLDKSRKNSRRSILGSIVIKENEEQNQKILMQKALKLNPSNEELISSLGIYLISTKKLLDIFDFEYLNDNDEEITNCSTKEYINRINVPKCYDKESINKIKNKYKNIANDSFNELNIYFYNKIISLGKGHFFGELALRDSKSVRTATIITTKECHFAYLTRKTYNNSLKMNTELHLKRQLIFFIKLPIFADMPVIVFYKKYYTRISKHYIMKNKFLIKQGEKPKELCLLNKGAYELMCNFNLYELTDLIFHLIGKSKKYPVNSEQNDLHYYKSILTKLKESVDREKILLAKNSNFKNLCSKETLMKISEMGCPDITGFEEIIGKDGLYSFSIQAKTIENIIYSIDINFYRELYNKNPSVQNRHDYIVKIKLDLIIKRLLKIRNNIISSFFNHKKEDDLSMVVSKEKEKLQNVKKIGKRFLNMRKTYFNFYHKNNISFDKKENKEKDFFNNTINFKNYNKNEKKDDNIFLSFKSKTINLIKKADNLNLEKEKNSTNDNLTKTSNKLIYLNLLPINKRKVFKTKYNNKINERKEMTLTETGNSIKGKKINKSIKCYFDRKIKVTDSINLTEKLQKKRIKLKLANYKFNSIHSNKKCYNINNILTESNDRKQKILINEEKKYNYLERLVTPKNIKFNTLLLTNKSINLANRNSFFRDSIKKLIKFDTKRENIKEKIEELLKDDDYNKDDINITNERKYMNKRVEHYKKNLIRLKLFYGFDKK